MASMETRMLAPEDAPWAAALMAERRELYASYSPVFWRPARGVTGLHARFIRRQIEDAANVAVRTEHGFLIAQPRAGEGFVDDFAVDSAGTWRDDGAALLLADTVADDADPAVLEHEAAALGAVLAVVPAPPRSDRGQRLARRGWTVASQWYLGQPG
jgi:hypothetical protein